jgi:uncharacterized membrane protein YgcG
MSRELHELTALNGATIRRAAVRHREDVTACTHCTRCACLPFRLTSLSILHVPAPVVVPQKVPHRRGDTIGAEPRFPENLVAFASHVEVCDGLFRQRARGGPTAGMGGSSGRGGASATGGSSGRGGAGASVRFERTSGVHDGRRLRSGRGLRNDLRLVQDPLLIDTINGLCV